VSVPSFQQVIPQPFVLEVEFSPQQQLTCGLDSFGGEVAKEGVGQFPSDAVVLLLGQQADAFLYGQIGMDMLQRPAGVDAKMLFGGGERLGHGLQHDWAPILVKVSAHSWLRMSAAVLQQLGATISGMVVSR